MIVAPKVSVIIPTYNRCALVQEAVDSVLAQTYIDYEIVVVDDGSTDGTEKVLPGCYGDRIRYVWQENQGESVARNRGIEMTRSEYVAFLDSDDLWLSEKLAQQISLLDANPQIAVVFCQASYMDINGCVLNVPPLACGPEWVNVALDHLFIENEIAPSTVIVRRSALDQVGGFDSNLRFGEDWDLWLRLRVCHDFVIVPEALALIRYHNNTQSHLQSSENVERILSDHLRLLEKAFNLRDDSHKTLEIVRNLALARQYGEAAFGSYACSRWDKGCSYLEQAGALDPSVWRDNENLTQMLINTGIAAAVTQGSLPLEWIHEYLDGTLSHLPSGLHLPSRTYRRALGRLCAEAAYRSYLSGDHSGTRHFTLQAFGADPTWLSDRGMIRRLVASVV